MFCHYKYREVCLWISSPLNGSSLFCVILLSCIFLVDEGENVQGQLFYLKHSSLLLGVICKSASTHISTYVIGSIFYIV